MYLEDTLGKYLKKSVPYDEAVAGGVKAHEHMVARKILTHKADLAIDNARNSKFLSFLDYDISRQIELESYGYRFLRLNKFTLRPEQAGETSTDVLNRLLYQSFGDN